MGHRHYDAQLGRFLSRDPIGFSGGVNLYEYAGANPSTFADPRGLFVEEATVGGWTASRWIAAFEASAAGVGTGVVTGGNIPAAVTVALLVFASTKKTGNGDLEDNPALYNPPGHADSMLSRSQSLARMRDASGSGKGRGLPCSEKVTVLSEHMLRPGANIDWLLAAATTKNNITTVKVDALLAMQGKQANIASVLNLFRHTARSHGATQLYVEANIINEELMGSVERLIQRGVLRGTTSRFEIPLRF